MLHEVGNYKNYLEFKSEQKVRRKASKKFAQYPETPIQNNKFDDYDKSAHKNIKFGVDINSRYETNCVDRNLEKSTRQGKQSKISYDHIQPLINDENYANFQNEESANSVYNIMSKRHYRSHNRN